MTPLYLDTGLILKLLIAEPLSPAVEAFVQKLGRPIWYTRIAEIEVENTLQALQFRRLLTVTETRRAQSLIRELLTEGKFIASTLTLDAMAEELLRLAPALTARTGCRTLDLMHLAAAKLLDAADFVSTDQRQLKAARLAGFKTFDLTKLG